MPEYVVRLNTTLSLAITVEADDEDTAADLAWEMAEQYAQTLNGNSRDVRADASFDGIGAEEIELAR